MDNLLCILAPKVYRSYNTFLDNVIEARAVGDGVTSGQKPTPYFVGARSTLRPSGGQ